MKEFEGRMELLRLKNKQVGRIEVEELEKSSGLESKSRI